MSAFSKYKRWVFLGGGIATYAALVYYGDPLLLLLLASAGFSFAAFGIAVVLIFCVIVGLYQRHICMSGVGIVDIFRLIARRSVPSINRTLVPLAVIGVFAGLLLVSLPINKAIQRQAADEAKAYPDLVAPLLEQYRQQHGAYPSSLDQLPSRPRVPRLLRSSYGYRSDGVEYSFCFRRMINSWDYSSRTHKWHHSD